MKLQEAWRDVIRPTMRREPKTPGSKGVEVVMVDLNGDGVPDPPVREPIAVVHATQWAHHNSYVKGQAVYCNVAAFSGGAEGTIYRWRLQKRADAQSDWQNYSWNNYSDHALEINVTCPEGQMRIHCQARDASVEPVDQVNSFSTTETVTTPTLLPMTIQANGEAYDPSSETLDGTAGESFLLVASPAASGLIPLNYSWTVRSGSARLTPAGSTCTVILQSTETELVSIQADIVDFTEACPDTPQSVRFNVMTRAALRVETSGTWKASNSYQPGSWAHFQGASFAGPDAASAELTWRSQKQPPGDDRWWSGNWAVYSAGGESLSFKAPDSGLIRFQCKATTGGESVVFTSPTQRIA